ncbi:hypothetical protein [Streptomyces sp. NPDC050560]|uniref:hypothetical protein n=1 Tax=Streptomyces sp. NPDC050560 TaxID=3365630 RepID=UPI0037BC12DA
MQDMIEALGALRDPEARPPAGTDEVEADIARGRRALARRRRLRIAGAGSAAALAAVGALVTATTRTAAPAHDTAAPRTTAPPATSAAPTLRLAAYTGDQPPGFRVDTLPRGWKVTSVDREDFVAVPPGTKEHPTTPGAVSLTDGIAVMLQGMSRFPADAHLTPVTVRGHPGQLGRTGDRSATWLVFPDAAGHRVLVQVPVELGLTDGQIVRFAQGITVTRDARATGG